MDYPWYFSCTGVQCRKVVNQVFVVAGTSTALDVPAGGRYLVYHPLLSIMDRDGKAQKISQYLRKYL